MRAYRKTLVGLAFAGLALAQSANLQLIHAVADVVGVNTPVILDSIDIYISADNGTNWTLAVPDYKFRQATPYLAVPPNSTTTIAGIAPGNSTGPGSILLQYTLPSFAPGSYNVGTVSGTVDLAANNIDIQINYFQNSRNVAQNSNALEVIAFHGSPDAPSPVALYLALGSNQHGYIPNLHLGYRQYTPTYLAFTSDELLAVGDSVDRNVILPNSYYVPNPSSAGLQGAAGVVFASGYLNTSDSRKAFGLHLALPTGNVVALPTEPIRRVQIVHNAADPALAQVDIHPVTFPANPPIPLDFRQALPAIFVNGTGNLPLTFSARGNTTTPLATINLPLPAPGSNAAVFAQGVANPSNFAANPNGLPIAFELKAFTGVKGAEASGSFAAMPFHGATDAPTVDVEIVGVGTVPGLSYGSNANAPVTFASGAARTINVKVGTTVVASFQLSAAQAQSQVGAIIFASGFLNPSNNQNGPAFGLFIVYPTGVVQPLTLVTSLATRPAQALQVYTFPTYQDAWTVSVGATSASKLPYRLTTALGQVVSEGEWEVPGAGSWVYTVPAHNLPAGVYLLQVDTQTFRLVR